MDPTGEAGEVPSLQSCAILAELRSGHSTRTRHEVWRGLGSEFVLVAVERMGELPARLRILPATEASAWILRSPEVLLATYLAGDLCAVDLGDWTDRVDIVWRELRAPEEDLWATWEMVAYELERFRKEGGPAAKRLAELARELSGRADYERDVRMLCLARCYPTTELAAQTRHEALDDFSRGAAGW